MRSLTRALVVGGAGFFGNWLVEELMEQRIETTVLDLLPPATEVAGFVRGDVAEVDLSALLEERGIDVVFQLAGTGFVPWSLDHPQDDLQRNAGATLAVLEAARHVRRPPAVAFVSSAAVYGEGHRFPIDESHPLAPLSPYGVSKLAAEQYVQLYAGLHELETFSVRPFSLYGPRQRKLVVHDLLVRMLAGEDEIVIESSAEVTRDFVFVHDAARSLVALTRNAPAGGEAYNFASGKPTTLGELAAALVEAAGADTNVRFTGTRRPGDPARWEGDARRALALGATFDTPLANGLRATAAWLRTNPSASDTR